MSSNNVERPFGHVLAPADVGAHEDIPINRVAVYDERPNSRAELERHNTELRRRVHKLELLLNTIPIGIGIASDSSCTNIAVNPALANILSIPWDGNASMSGIGADKLPYRYVRDGVDIPPEELPLQYAAACGEDIETELEVEMDDGRYVTMWHSARPLFDEAGSACGSVCVVSDVTDHKREIWAGKFLVRASEILASSLDLPTTLDNLARQVVPHLADAYVLDLLDERGQLTRVSERVADVNNPQLQDALLAMTPPDDLSQHPLHDVLRTGVPFFTNERDRSVFAKRTTRPPKLTTTLRSLDVVSIIIVPLEARGRTLGTMSMATMSRRRPFDRKDLAVAAELARRAAMAVDNARLLASAERSREEAQRANRAKSDFLATMSHELRTARSSAIAGYARSSCSWGSAAISRRRSATIWSVSPRINDASWG